MQKRLLVIAAGLLQVPVIKKAREMGHYVIAADGDPTAPGLARADKGVVIDIRDKDAMLRLALKERIDGTIHPCSETAMDVMGYINDRMGLPGNSEEVCVRATNKRLMRLAFERGGAPSPVSKCFGDAEAAWHSFRADFNGACILKPSRNSGSRGIAKVPETIGKEEFARLFETSKRESRDDTVMLEQFVEGPEFSVEIIVCDGEPHVLQVTDKKTTGAPHFVELGHSQPSLFPPETVEKLKDGAVKGVKALGLKNCAAHAELKVQTVAGENGKAQEKAYLMEIGARMGGDFIATELTHLSTGVDMVAAAVDVALGVKPDLGKKEEPRGVCIRYFCPKPGRLVSISGTGALNNPHVYKKKIYVKPGDTIPQVTSSLCRSGHVIVTAATPQQAIALAERLTNEVKFETE